MTNAYSFDGLVVFGLLLICTCAYMKRVPKLKQWFLSEKKGFLGVFYKGAVIGSRLHIPVAIACVTMGIYVLFIKWLAVGLVRFDCCSNASWFTSTLETWNDTAIDQCLFPAAWITSSDRQAGFIGCDRRTRMSCAPGCSARCTELKEEYWEEALKWQAWGTPQNGMKGAQFRNFIAQYIYIYMKGDS